MDHTKKKPHSSADQALSSGLDRLADVPLRVTVELGRTRLLLGDLLRLAPGALVELDRLVGEPLDIRIGDKLIGRGEAVVTGNRLGVRVTEIVADEPIPARLNESA